MQRFLPSFATELAFAKDAARGTRHHFSQHFFQGNGETISVRQLDRHTSQALTLFMIVGMLLAAALLRDIMLLPRR